MKSPGVHLVFLLGGVVALSLPFILIGGVIAYETGREYLARRSFDPAAWQDSARVFSPNPVRIRMVDDLLERHDLDELTGADVAALLGDPDDTPYFREWDLVYWLGPERGLIGMDSEWLVLRLNAAQQVTEHRVLTD